MSIRDDAYALCKAVGIAPERKRIADLIISLNSRDIGYLGGKQFAQILGYLSVEQNRLSIAQKPMSFHISALAENERELLSNAHAQIAQLNQKCVETLLVSLPKLAKVIDPYSGFTYVPPKKTIPIDFLAPADIDKMAKSFHSHPQIEIALESARNFPQFPPPENILKEVFDMNDTFLTADVREVPEWLIEAKNYMHDSSLRRIYIRHISALCSIRVSLSILNQMIYQKIFGDTLERFDDENIISVASWAPRNYIRLIYQNVGLLYLLETKDIVFTNFNDNGIQIKELCRIERLVPALTPDFGEPRYTELRVIDENLSPYAELLHRL